MFSKEILLSSRTFRHCYLVFKEQLSGRWFIEGPSKCQRPCKIKLTFFLFHPTAKKCFNLLNYEVQRKVAIQRHYNTR
jgi:hypothetical protein